VVAELISDTPSPIPTETLTPTPTETPTPELTAEVTVESAEAQVIDLPVSEQEVTKVAQLDTPAPDNYSLTATEIVRTATEGASISITLTAIALGLGATATPTLTETPTIDPFALATPTSQFVLAGTDCIHEVRQGETLFRLSMYYGLPVNQIAAANGILNPNLIVVAQKLVIPGCGTTGALPPATSTPTATFEPFGASAATDTTTGAVTGATTATNTCGPSYIVQQYETLFQISLRCNVPVQSIANANGITNINRINMGDILNIPPF
jgi:LysM repeat protein